MLRALTLIAVRQQEPDTGRLVPLLFARCDELIDNDLSGVDEVAKLSFPQHQRGRRRDAVAVFEPERARFAQRAVIDFVFRPVRKLSERRPLFAGLRVGECRVTMAERSANGVLT